MDEHDVKGDGQTTLLPVVRSAWQMQCSITKAEIAKTIAFGQVLSVLIAGTGITSQLLASRYHVAVPTTQSLLNYILLCLYWIPLVMKRGKTGALDLLRSKFLVYTFLAFADVEANYLVVKAYQYTSITSVMLLDCFTIPCVMVLSWFFLKTRYRATHYGGVMLCVAGLGLLVLSDVDHGGSGDNPVLGDMLCLGGAFLYAVSNVGQEGMVKKYDFLEFLAMIGLFGSVINGVQLAILERHELRQLHWSGPVVGLLIAFGICLFAMYSLTPHMLRLSSATLLNLSLLTSDVFAILAGVFLFDYVPSWIYFVSLVVIVAGLVLYNWLPTSTSSSSTTPAANGSAAPTATGYTALSAPEQEAQDGEEEAVQQDDEEEEEEPQQR